MSDSKGAAIEKILRSLAEWCVETANVSNGEIAQSKQAILAILAQEVKRVIGEDEPEEFVDENQDSRISEFAIERNELRAEQRRKAGLV